MKNLRTILTLVKAGYSKKEIDAMDEEEVQEVVEEVKQEKEANPPQTEIEKCLLAKFEEMQTALDTLKSERQKEAIQKSEIEGEKSLEESLLEFLPKGYELNK